MVENVRDEASTAHPNDVARGIVQGERRILQHFRVQLVLGEIEHRVVVEKRCNVCTSSGTIAARRGFIHYLWQGAHPPAHAIQYANSYKHVKHVGPGKDLDNPTNQRLA